MRERVRADGGVRLARPRMQHLSSAMEREATMLLAGLLWEAAGRDGGVCKGALGGVYPGAFDGATYKGERPHGSGGSRRWASPDK
jgi:hypothetical protein